jgi:hypothetical protein
LDPGSPPLADAGMENGFELFASGGIRKNPAGQFVAAEVTVRPNDAWAESSLNLGESRLSGFDDFAGEHVGVNDRDGARAKEIRGSGFTHAYATGETQQSHFIIRVTSRCNCARD